MCRTGLRGPGQSHRIPWGSGEVCLNAKAAQKVAKSWVKDICSTFESVDAIVVDLFDASFASPLMCDLKLRRQNCRRFPTPASPLQDAKQKAGSSI